MIDPFAGEENKCTDSRRRLKSPKENITLGESVSKVVKEEKEASLFVFQGWKMRCYMADNGV